MYALLLHRILLGSVILNMIYHSVIQATLLRTASLYFHRGLRKCFTDAYARLFDIPDAIRIDNDVSGFPPTYIPAAR